jgi:hypothetical protein
VQQGLVSCPRSALSALRASLFAQPHDDDGTITVAELSLLGPEVNRVPGRGRPGISPVGLRGEDMHRRPCATRALVRGGDGDAPGKNYLGSGTV